jgi:hypothetical protein
MLWKSLQPKRLAMAACLVCLPAAAALAQSTSTATRTVQFEVVGVDGNKVFVKGPQGPREYVTAPDQMFTVDGKQVGVADLKPGMKGTAKITTTTKVIPVHVTEVRNGEVVQANGNSIIVRGADGIKMFSEKDVKDRDIEIMKDGKAASISDLRQGDKLTATIVSQGTPKVLTEHQLEATLASPAAAAPAAGAPAAASGSAAPSAAATTGSAAGTPAHPRAKKLPKTGTEWPLAGLMGTFLLAMALTVRMARNRG